MAQDSDAVDAQIIEATSESETFGDADVTDKYGLNLTRDNRLQLTQDTNVWAEFNLDTNEINTTERTTVERTESGVEVVRETSVETTTIVIELPAFSNE